MEIKNEKDLDKFIEGEYIEVDTLWDFIRQDLPVNLRTIDKKGVHYLVIELPLKSHEERLSD